MPTGEGEEGRSIFRIKIASLKWTESSAPSPDVLIATRSLGPPRNDDGQTEEDGDARARQNKKSMREN